MQQNTVGEGTLEDDCEVCIMDEEKAFPFAEQEWSTFYLHVI